MLTINDLMRFQPRTIFATGTAKDEPGGLFMAGTGKELRWVAVRGAIEDWAIYCHYAECDEYDIRDHGDKVCFETHIRRLVPCDDEAYAMYRF